MHRLTLSLIVLLVLGISGAQGEEPKSRMLEFDYEVTLKDIPGDVKTLRVWMPHLPETPYQVIEETRIDPDELAIITYDKTYNNKIITYAIPSPRESSYTFRVHYKVRRSEFLSKISLSPLKEKETGEDLDKYLKSNQLVTLSPRVKDLAADIIKEKGPTMERARAIYDYVLDNVAYDKSIPGWGQGDTERVCLIKAGNCTDFHSLFISLSRAGGIPAKFVIGVPISQEREGELKGYHCWAEFYDQARGWVPVDISEAWKDKAKKEYYFGTVGQNRLEFTHGRDIILEPVQSGEPLNYFVYPYVEIDGKEFKNLSVSFKYRDSRGASEDPRLYSDITASARYDKEG